MEDLLDDTRLAYSSPGRVVPTKATPSTTPRTPPSPKPDWLLLLMIGLILLTLLIIWQTDLIRFF
ncbi:hypothetical protein DYU11_26375 [Fibrisoma montanum]|uniref:Uncharacterized protein n=2 Tax=Fibrisoma montanum TaxID=2305895 RepID=A0A418M0C0_9BACT|nr:hypothetical protein DYU11_26375 [Fibrisoma montanum]